jgi:hypothetical protein
MSNLKIELTPKDALILASFHNEFKVDIEGDNRCVTLLAAMNSFMDQVVSQMPESSFDDACAEIEVDVLLGRAPDNRDTDG